MTYKEWESDLKKIGVRRIDAIRELGVSQQAVSKWKKDDKVSWLGLYYYRVKHEANLSLDKIREVKQAMYGDIEDNIIRASKVRQSIIVTYESITGDETVVKEAIFSITNLLSLKAVRSSSCKKGENCTRLLIDFKNYHFLLLFILQKHCKFPVIKYKEPFCFTELTKHTNIVKIF